MYVFQNVCKEFGLSWFKREIHMIKYGDKPASIVIGYEVPIKRADRTKKLDGWKVEIVDKATVTERAIITIWRKDFKEPFVWEVSKKEASKNQATWVSMPDFMLKKVAIGQGFRLAFPDELGGLPYVKEEMVQDEVTTKPSFTPYVQEEKPIDPPAPEQVDVKPKEEVKPKVDKKDLCTKEQINQIVDLLNSCEDMIGMSERMCKAYKVELYTELTKVQADEAIRTLIDKYNLGQKKDKK